MLKNKNKNKYNKKGRSSMLKNNNKNKYNKKGK